MVLERRGAPWGRALASRSLQLGVVLLAAFVVAIPPTIHDPLPITGGGSTPALGAAPPLLPAGVIGYVPVNITNNESNATVHDFNERVVVNSTYFRAWEEAHLRNVMFFDAQGTVVPSWLESGGLNNSSSSIYWLNLSAGIPAHSTVTVYLGFGNLSSSALMDGNWTGEAPTLSPHYGGLDDGSRVFPHYENFASNDRQFKGVHRTGWYSSGGTGPYAYNHVQNGWLTDGVNGGGLEYVGSDFPVNRSVAVDLYVQDFQAVHGDWQAPFVLSRNATSFVPMGDVVRWSDQGAPCNAFNSNATFEVANYTTGRVLTNVSGRYPPGVFTVTDQFVDEGYRAVLHHNGIISGSGYFATAVFSSWGCGSSFVGHWVRTRVLPPLGLMPVAVVGRTVL
ncbi:MAG TPA: hypothetical protein VGV89_06925 [Thermoplasmata archaeon]|nr:hypothetical protein [Thermoplasmata archaeon]